MFYIRASWIVRFVVWFLRMSNAIVHFLRARCHCAPTLNLVRARLAQPPPPLPAPRAPPAPPHTSRCALTILCCLSIRSLGLIYGIHSKTKSKQTLQTPSIACANMFCGSNSGLLTLTTFFVRPRPGEVLGRKSALCTER